MAADQPMTSRILDAAEGMIRTQGYNGFSFRDIADAVGIKSASVHYHFATKADLGAAVARRYADRFMDELGDPSEKGISGPELLQRYVAIFRRAITRDKQMCLCGMLGAEIASLPAEVKEQVKSFFERSIEWLEMVLKKSRPDSETHEEILRRRALTILAALEGAIIIARTMGSAEVLDDVVLEIVVGARNGSN